MAIRTLQGISYISLIPELEDSPYIWRFDLAGNLQIGNTHHTTEPLVRLYFTRLVDDWSPNLYNRSPFLARYVHRNSRKQRVTKTVDCGVGLLQVLPVGCVCFYGEWCYHEDPPKENIHRFKKLHISKDTAHPAHDILPDKKKTEYLQISYNQGGYDGLIIPMMEVVRFYYARTTRFMAMLFTSEIIQLNRSIANLTKSGHLNDGKNTYRIQLRPRMLDLDAPVIARIVANMEIAHSAASMIRNSYILNRQKHGNNDIPITTKIPFEGKTDLTAMGVNFISSQKKYFRVIRLLKCSHPFPWQRLEIGRDNDGRSDKTKDTSRPEAYTGSQGNVRLPTDGGNKPVVSYDDNPDIDRGLYEICRWENRYTDLEGKEISRPPKKPSKTRAGEKQPMPEITGEDTVTTGPATNQGTRMGNIETTEIESNTERSLSILCPEVIEWIECEENYQTQAIPVNNPEDGNFSYFPTHKADNSLISWSFLDKKKKERRWAFLVELYSSDDNHYFYLLETGRRKGKSEAYCLLIIYQKGFPKIGNNTHENFLAALAANRFSKYREIAKGMGLRVVAVKHTSSENKKYAKRIIDKIKAIQ